MAVTDILTQIDVAPGLNHPVIDVPVTTGRQNSDSQKQFARSLEQAQRRTSNDPSERSVDDEQPPEPRSAADSTSRADRNRSTSEAPRPAGKNKSRRTEKQPANGVDAGRPQEAEQIESDPDEAELNSTAVEPDSDDGRPIELSPRPALATQITQTIAETLDLPEPPASLPAFLSVDAAGDGLDLTDENRETPAERVPLPPPGLFQSLAAQATDPQVAQLTASDATGDVEQPFGSSLPDSVASPDAAAVRSLSNEIVSGDGETVAPSNSIDLSGIAALDEAIAADDDAPQETPPADPLVTAVITDTIHVDARTTTSAIPRSAEIAANNLPDGPVRGNPQQVDADLQSDGHAGTGNSETFDFAVDAPGTGNSSAQQSSTAAERIAELGQSGGTTAESPVGKVPSDSTTSTGNASQIKSAPHTTTSVNNLDGASVAKPAQAHAAAEVQPSAPNSAKPSQTIDRVSQTVRLAHGQGRPLRVRLHPPELGTVQVEVASRNGHLVARLDVQTPAAHRVILDNMSLLHDALAHHGTSIDRVDVHLTDNSDADNRPDFSQQQENNSQQEDTQQHGQRGYNESATASDESAAEQTVPSPSATIDQLDIQV